MIQLALAVWLVASFTTMSTNPKRPPAERDEPTSCSHWQGTASGNDPSIRITVILCPHANNRVTGTLVWESKRSGTNTRALEGTQSGKSFTLRDVSLAGQPAPGWRFCKIDRYELALSGDTRLAGTYHSAECNDDATLTLERVR
jgi:hypothetical protein